jgi:ketosteroid isomerase-like protein
MSKTPREVAELVRQTVEGRGDLVFADLFAEDGVMEYPFGIPGQLMTLDGQAAIREFFHSRGGLRDLFDMAEVTAVVHETQDPEVVIVEIDHHGHSHIADGPYQMHALGIIRVRDGRIVHYRDYMNPLALAKLTGRMPELLTAVGL